MDRQWFLVNHPGKRKPSTRRALLRNRMVRPTAAYLRTPAGRAAWGGLSAVEAGRIYDRAFSKGTPPELRPVGPREKLPAPYGREQARRDYLAALRAPLKVPKGMSAAYDKLERAALAQDVLDLDKLPRLGQWQNPPKRRRGKKPRRNPAALEARKMARRRSRSRSRKGTARRPRRRAVARVTLAANPRHKRKRHSTARRSTRRRSFHRNPRGGLMGALGAALVNGLTVTGGVGLQNATVRYVPDFIPATVPQAPMLNSLAKDAAGILAGAWGAAKIIGARRAEFFVAGQVHAAVARVVRAANIPTVSTLMGEYDPIRMGTYTNGISRLPAVAGSNQGTGGATGNVRALSGVGIYSDGVSFAPSLY